MSALEETADLTRQDSGAEGGSASSALLNGRPVMPELEGLSDDSFILPPSGTAREKVQAGRRKRAREAAEKRAQKRQARAEQEEESQLQEESRIQTLERQERRREKENQGGGDLPIEVPVPEGTAEVTSAEANTPSSESLDTPLNEQPAPAIIAAAEPLTPPLLESELPQPAAVSVPEPEVASIPEPEVASTVEPEVASTAEPEVASAVEPEVASTVEPEAPSIPEPEVASIQEPQVISAVPVAENGNGFHVHGAVNGTGHHFIHGNGNVVNNYYGAIPGAAGAAGAPAQGQGPEGNGPAGNDPESNGNGNGNGAEGKDPQADEKAGKPKRQGELVPPRRNQQELPQLQNVQFREFPHLKLISHEQENWAEQAVHSIYEIKAAMTEKVINDLGALRNFLQTRRLKKKIEARNAQDNHAFSLDAAAYVPQKVAQVKTLEDQVQASGVNVHKGNLGKIGKEFVTAAKRAEKLAHKYAHSDSYKKHQKVAEANETQIAALHMYEAALAAEQAHQQR